jgi:transitional endoplasmic reticulum ATPase
MALRGSIEAIEVTMVEFEAALTETRASVTPEMEVEYERIQEHLKQDALGANSGIGFVTPGMLTSRGNKSYDK